MAASDRPAGYRADDRRIAPPTLTSKAAESPRLARRARSSSAEPSPFIEAIRTTRGDISGPWNIPAAEKGFFKEAGREIALGMPA